MKNSKEFSCAVCANYATALFDSAEEAGALEDVRQNLCDMAGLLASDKTLRRALFSPGIGQQGKLKALFEIAGAGGFTAHFFDFLQLLLARRRLSILPGIYGRFEDLYDRRRGQLRVYVKTAVGLSPQQRESLSCALAARTGRKVLLEEAIDEDVIGGIYLRAKDEVFDFSAASGINRLKEAMRG